MSFGDRLSASWRAGGRDSSSRALTSLLGLLGCAGYLQMINSGAAPLYAAEFALSETELSRMFAWMSVGAVGALALTRRMDRVGRRRVLLVSIAGLAAGSVATGFSPTLQWLIAAQIGVWVFRGGLQSAGTVIVAEELPSRVRARGQAATGAALYLGSGAALIVCACVAGVPGSWRWAWVVPALPVLALPAVARALRETAPFEAAAARGDTQQAQVADLFRARYARRTWGVLSAQILANVTSYATMTWLLYHGVATLGLTPFVATGVVIAGGALGLVGFPLGAYLSDRIGRRATALVSGIAFTIANVGYYWVPRDLWPSPVPVLLVLFAVASVGFAGYTVAMRTAATELFPTSLRGTLQGFIGAVASLGALIALVSIALLTDALGGLVPAVSLVGVACIPGVLIFYFALPETAGWELE